MMPRLKEILQNVCEKQKTELKEFNGEADHVHLLVSIAPDVQISQLVASLKSASSRIIRTEFAEHLKKYYSLPVFWHDAYCAVSCGGAPLEIVKQYILNQ